MKEKILIFLLGVFVTISIAATTGDLMTVKPAKPVSTISEWFKFTGSAISYIDNNSKQGYQVKLIAGTDDEWLVVMEKY